MNPGHALSIGCIVFVLAGCAPGATPPPPARQPTTLTPQVVIAHSEAIAEQTTIAGRVWWGSTPIAAARVELRTGAWADPNAGQTVAETTSGDDGAFALEAPAAGGEFGLAAIWPDGGTNQAPVTPVQIGAGQALQDVAVYLAHELALLEPISGAEVSTTPTLRWTGMPGVAAYKLWIIDAGTTEVVFDLTITEMSETMELVAPPLTPGRAYRWVVNGLEANNDDSSAGNLLASLTSEFRVQ